MWIKDKASRLALGAGVAAAGALALAGPAAAASGSLPQDGQPVSLNPADFTSSVTNPFFPLVPGTRMVYREQDAQGDVQKGVTRVTNRTKPIANGITARVVHDVVTERGEPIEKTFDWYAQDSAGNVWYLGEDAPRRKSGTGL
jgi:hypothetical protein